MSTFYKIENNELQTGSGDFIPDGFIEYTVGEEPAELLNMIAEEANKQLEVNRKLEVAKQLSSLTVTSSKGNVFDANNQARLDMQNAITASEFLGITETSWRMANDVEVLIGLDELKEALALSIQEYAIIKGIGA